MLGLHPVQPVDDEEDKNETVLPGSTVVVGGLETVDHVWVSCCFRINSNCVVYAVQTVVACALIIFSCFCVATETNADKSAQYWGLIGTMCGFIFIKARSDRRKVDGKFAV